MITLDETSEFIEQHWPVSMTWAEGALDNWITWAASNHFLFQAIGENGLEGIVIARPIESVENAGDNTSNYDEFGRCIFLDLVIGETKPVAQALTLGVIHRFGQREFLAFKRNGKLKIHKWASVRAALLKTKHNSA